MPKVVYARLRHAGMFDQPCGVGLIVDEHGVNRPAAELGVEGGDVPGAERIRAGDSDLFAVVAVRGEDRCGDGVPS